MKNIIIIFGIIAFNPSVLGINFIKPIPKIPPRNITRLYHVDEEDLESLKTNEIRVTPGENIPENCPQSWYM